jgi:NADH-quinone oxidoreductase subunit H
VLIPISVVWIVLVAIARVIDLRGGVSRPVLIGAAIGLAVLLLVIALIPERKPAEVEVDDEPFDAFAGGFPVPPMPGTGRATVGASAETTLRSTEQGSER